MPLQRQSLSFSAKKDSHVLQQATNTRFSGDTTVGIELVVKGTSSDAKIGDNRDKRDKALQSTAVE